MERYYHVYAEDGFESGHRSAGAARRAAQRGANRRCMPMAVVETDSHGESGEGRGSLIGKVRPNRPCRREE